MYLADLNWPAVQALNRNLPVVIPVAAVEQHGHHLPVYTDSMLLGEVVRRVEQQLANRALFLPLQWYGNSHHHMDYPGTLSVEPRQYLDLLINLAENMLRHGFTRLIFLNGHGGNVTPGKQAVFELKQKLRQRDDLMVLFATYWEFAEPWQEGVELEQHEMGHACEWETSMILRLKPELVVGEVAQLQTEPLGFGFGRAYRGWVTQERTSTGHIGSPQFATAEKGELLFASFSRGVVELIEKVERWNGKGWA